MSSFFSSFGWSDPLILPKCHLPRWLLTLIAVKVSLHLHSDDLSSTVWPELRVALRCRFKRHILRMDTNKNWQQMSTLVQFRTRLPVDKVLRRLRALCHIQLELPTCFGSWDGSKASTWSIRRRRAAAALSPEALKHVAAKEIKLSTVHMNTAKA